MKINGKALKIGEGVSFDEAQIIYKIYELSVKGKRVYRAHGPLFIKMGDGRRQIVLHETSSMICLNRCSKRNIKKRPYCDWLLVKVYKDGGWSVANKKIRGN